jgi:transcriptional regulator with XRE-family HTH domain
VFIVTRILVTSDELEQLLGSHLRALRIRHNFTQRALAERANVALGAVRNAESGRGATVRTLVRILKALDRADWIDALAPQVSVSPLQVLTSRSRRPRQRASAARAPGTPRTPQSQAAPEEPDDV